MTAHEVTTNISVSPALNVKLSSILSTSLVSTSSSGPEYKLTLMKGGLSAAVGAVTRKGDEVTILFAVDPLGGPTQVSVVVTKDEWAKWEGLNHDAGLLQYARLDAQWDENGIGTGTFTLDSSKVSGAWGKDYHVYIFAEEVKGGKETDYAGAPLEVESPISVSVEGYEGIYDGQAHGIAVTADYSYDYHIKYRRAGETEYQDECPTFKDAADSPYTIEYQVIVLIDKIAAEGSATVTIHKVPLAIKAKDHQITYGDEPSNGGVTYTGFVNGETESVLQGALSYDYSYHPYDDVGDGYAITPKGLVSGNYAINYEPGKLTVAPRPITVSGIAARTRPYDGTPTAVLDFSNAALEGRLDGDDVSISGTGTFRDVNAGVGKTVVISDLRLEGTRAYNANVAAVDGRGRVKGVGKGTCTIYAIANNGVRSRVKVTVK